MISDAQLYFSDAQAVTADGYATNTIDLQSPRKLFFGEQTVLVLKASAVDITTGDETYSFQLRTDDNAANTSPTTIATQSFTAAQLAAGLCVMAIPPGVQCERYLSLYYDVGGTTPSMTITAFLQPNNMVPQEAYYPRAYTIS